MSASFSQHNRIVPIEPLTGLELNEGVLHLPEDRHVDMRLDDVTERSLQARLEQPCLFVEPVFRNRIDVPRQCHVFPPKVKASLPKEGPIHTFLKVRLGPGRFSGIAAHPTPSATGNQAESGAPVRRNPEGWA